KIRQSPSQPRRAARVSRSFGENLTPLSSPLQNCGPHHSSMIVELSNRWQGTRIMRGPIRTPTEQEQSMSDLKGKVAIVTGAAKGIGAGIDKNLAAAGAAVTVHSASSREAAERVVAHVKA